MKTFKPFLFVLLSCALFSTAALADSEVCRTSEGFLDKVNPDIQKILSSKNGDGKGIGGTGEKVIEAHVSGVIYAYGSICVNGLRITYSQDQMVSDEKNSYPAKDLRLGQLVRVHAQKTEGASEMKALSIEADYAIQGPVTEVDPAHGLVYVMNQPVMVTGKNKTDKIRIGSQIKVSGLRDKEGRLVASFIAEKENTSGDGVSGILHADKDNRYYVGKTPVMIAKEDNPSSKVGQYVRIRGLWSDKALVANSIELSSLKPQVQTPSYISFEGYLEDIKEGNTVVMNGIEVHAKNLLCGDEPLEIGERLFGMGIIQPDGHINIDGFADQDAPETDLYIQ